MNRKQKMTAILAVAALLFIAAAGTGGCSRSAGEIRFADVGWDSVKFHNAVAGLVAESAFGYTWKEVPGSSPIMHEAMLKGEIDVNMEEWTDNLATYHADLADEKFKELGVNFDDNKIGRAHV